MARKQQEKRKKYLVDKIAQSKYAILVVVYLIIYNLILTIFIYLPTLLILSSEKAPLSAQAQAAREFLFLEGRYLPPLILVMFIMGLHSVISTHRFFGPIQRFKAVAKQISRGDFSVRVNLRKNDFLKDYQEDFNLMLDALDNRRKEINYISTKNSLLLTELLADMEKGKLSADEVGNKINEVLNKMKELTSLTEASPAASS